MYRIDDRKSAIKEVQRFLLIISQNDDNIPKVAIDGFYTEETRIAVEEYQKQRGVKVTGVVDRETFDMLYSEADEIMLDAEIRRGVANAEAFPLKLGDSGADVSDLNTLLRELSHFYKDITELPRGTFFSKITEGAVKIMQFHFKESESGIVTLVLYERLKEELYERGKFAMYY